jgi:hypothetical protein
MALGAASIALALTTVLLAGIVVGVQFDPKAKASPWREVPVGTDPGVVGPTLASEDHGHHHHMMMAGVDGILVPMDFDASTPPDLSHAPPFPLETGVLPTYDQAQQFTKKYSKFIAKDDQGIDKLRAEGYLQGDGTKERPYVLEQFYVDGELSITSTSRALIIRNGYVNGQFKLNYVGELVYVHHVYANDLRINENVQRTGANTGGRFHDNHFAFVGQIRHFTGEFLQNEVGPKPTNAIAESLGDAGITKVPTGVVFNFDGFHTADVHHNKFIGEVDMKLHGHNHGDCFTCPVHNHANDSADAAMHAGHDHGAAPANNSLGFASWHSVRYTSLSFHDNTIIVPGGVALRYNDRAHAGDDRTANSEPNKHLNDPHVHYQDITIRDNKLQGGSLLIDVYNAADDHHPIQDRGILRVWNNDVRVDYEAPRVGQARAPVTGIVLQSLDGLELSAKGNHVHFNELTSTEPGGALLSATAKPPELHGFDLRAADASNLTLAANTVDAGRVGVFAASFTGKVNWALLGNSFHTDEPWRGSDIKNPPKEE